MRLEGQTRVTRQNHTIQNIKTLSIYKAITVKLLSIKIID